MSDELKTYQQACDEIADWINRHLKAAKTDVPEITGTEIFHLDPNGHLMHISYMNKLAEQDADAIGLILTDKPIGRLFFRWLKKKREENG